MDLVMDHLFHWCVCVCVLLCFQFPIVFFLKDFILSHINESDIESPPHWFYFYQLFSATTVLFSFCVFYNVVLFLNNLLEFCQNKVVYIVDLRVIKNNTYPNLPIEISDYLIITDSFCIFYIKFLNNVARFFFYLFHILKEL